MFISGQGDIKGKNRAERDVVIDDDIAARLLNVAANQPESDAVIAAAAAGHAALKNTIAQRFINPATLIGDPPNILIGSSLNLSFMDFVKELTPVVVITMAVLILAFDLVYHKRIQTTLRHQVEVMKIRAGDSITDKSLLIKSLIVLFMVIGGFISAEHLHIANGTIAIFGAAVLLLLYTFGNAHS